MGHVTRMIEACHIYLRMKESGRTFMNECRHVWIFYDGVARDLHINESCDTHERVMSHIFTYEKVMI